MCLAVLGAQDKLAGNGLKEERMTCHIIKYKSIREGSMFLLLFTHSKV